VTLSGRWCGQPGQGELPLLCVSRLDDVSAGEAWDQLIGQRATSVTDLRAWRRVLRSTYGVPSHTLTCERGGDVVGGLTMAEIEHPIFGHYLVTAPFASEGGLHYDTAEVRDALLAEARALADSLQVDYLLVRVRDEDLDGFVAQRVYVSALIDLDQDPELHWRERLPTKTRNQIRKGMKGGFVLRAGSDQMPPFVEVLQARMRELGSPTHARDFYDNIREELKECAEFVVAYRDARPVAGALLFHFNGVAMNLHAVSLRRFNPTCVNYLVYWESLKRGMARGCRSFDMGRSVEGSSQQRFKRNWMPREIALSYNFYLRTMPRPPFVDPRNPKYQVATAVWRRLPPSITRRAGPRLISGLA